MHYDNGMTISHCDCEHLICSFAHYTQHIHSFCLLLHFWICNLFSNPDSGPFHSLAHLNSFHFIIAACGKKRAKEELCLSSYIKMNNKMRISVKCTRTSHNVPSLWKWLKCSSLHRKRSKNQKKLKQKQQHHQQQQQEQIKTLHKTIYLTLNIRDDVTPSQH